MANRSNKWRYQLPENWTVEDTACAIVQIPNDPEYLAILTGLLDELKRADTFEYDATGTGAKTVAATWRDALEQRPITTIDCEEIDMTDMRRVKPGFPYISQQSTDGGETWVDYLIQPNWEAYTSAISATVPAAVAENSGSIAGGLLKTIANVCQNILDQLGDGLSVDNVTNNVYDDLARFQPLPEAKTAIRTLVSAINDAPTGTADFLGEECTYADFWTELKDFLQGHSDDWIWHVGAYLNNVIQDAGMMGLDAWAEILAPVMDTSGGMNFWGKGVRDSFQYYPTFGSTCTWEQEWDFTAGDGGWSAVVSGGHQYAIYTPGVGWEADYCTDEISIHIAVPGSAETTGGEITGSAYGAGDANFVYIYRDATLYVGTLLVFSQDWTAVATDDIRVSVDEHSGCGGSVYAGAITGAKIRGTGINPFA